MIQRYKRTNLCVINSHYLYDQHGHCYCEGNKQKQAGEHSLGNLVCIGARPVHRKRYNVQPPSPLIDGDNSTYAYYVMSHHGAKSHPAHITCCHSYSAVLG